MKSFPAYYSSPAYRALRRHLLASGTAAALFTGASAFAADASWSLGTGGGNWNQDSAWTPAAAPGLTNGNTTSTDNATFDSTTRTVNSTIAVDTGRNIGNITFSTTNTFGYTLSSGSLVLSAGGTVLANGAGTGQNNINSPVTLQGHYTFTADSNFQLNNTAATFTTAPSLGNVTMTIGGVYGTGTITTSVLSTGIISQGTDSTLSIVKTGTGNWQFNGVNTFSGGFTVKQGFLGVGNSGAIGAGTLTLGDSSGSNNAAAGFGSNVNPTNAINVAAGSSGTLSLMRTGGSNQSTLSGPITLNNNLTISQNANNAQSFTISSGITGTGNLSITSLQGTGNTTLSGSVNMTGGITNNGVSASPTVITGVIGSNVTGITQNSTASNLVFSGTPTYSCPVTVTSGSLILQNTGAKSATSTITAAAAGTVALTVTGSGTGSLSPYTDADINSLFNDAISGIVLAPASNVGIDTGATNFTYSLSSGGTHGLTKLGSAVLTLNGANTYTGTTILAAGNLLLNSPESPGVSGPLGNSPAINPGSIVFRGGALRYSANNTFDYSGRLSSAANQPYNVDTNGQTVTWATGFGGTGGTFNKAGAGTLILSGNNTYTGATTLTAGNLTVGSPETPGVSGPLGNSPSTNPGSIVFRGGVLRYSTANNVDYTGRFSTSATQAFNVDTNGQNVTWANNLISSNGTLTKTGSGTLRLNGNNTYSGITTLGNGTLEVSNIGNFNNSGSNLGTASMGTLTNNASTGGSSTNSLQLVADAAPKTLRYVGAGETSDRAIYIRTQSVETAIESSGTGALILSGPISSYVPNVTTAINTSLIFGGNNTADNTFLAAFTEASQGAVNSAINIFKRGSGTWLLSGNKTYRGITFVEDGTFKFTSVANAGTNSALGSGNQLRIGGITPVAVPYGIVLGTASTAGTLDYVGTASSSSNRTIGLNGNGTLSNSAALAANTLTLTGGISSLTSGAKTLTLGGANTGSNTLSGVIADGSGTVSLTKVGAGNWTLSNTNTYTGSTSIQLGTLALTGSGSISAAPLSLATGSTLDISALSASTYTIANGLSGSGTINATGKPLTISGAYAPGALAITGDVTFGGSSASTFLASTVPGVSSATTVTGTVQNAGTLVINPAPSFTLAANQSFTFVTAGGGITPGYSGVTVNGLPLTNSAGVWSLTSGNLSYTYYESNATLTLAPDVVITALQSWRQTYFGTTENSGTAADSYDYDSDGIPNLVEYATNTNPTIAGPSVITAGTSGGHLTLTFPRIDDPSITYTVKGRDDLVTGSWSTVVPVAGNNPTSGFTGSTPGVTETVSETVIDTATLGSPSKRFLRLEIGITP